jgi:NAD(P)-dependent dehydrogenase (short-subunit alcohol dehydrogenase family)
LLLQGKVAIVTGAAQGIGRAVAQVYAAEGASVVLCDLHIRKTKAAAEEIAKETGAATRAAKVDVTRRDQIQDVVDRARDELGHIDILVNNAGILKHVSMVDMLEQDWDRVFAVNVKGVFLFTQAVGRIMMAQRGGKIVNMSSCSAKKADALQAAYNASKAAILGFTRVAALELGPYGINCNAICPGATDTEMVRSTFLTSPEVEREWIEKTALKRLGRPEDVARVALFLASSLSDHITGEALIVSAGEMMSQ